MREFGSEFPSILCSDHYFERLAKYGNLLFLRSGRDALSLASKNIKRNSNIVFLPAYCCWSMSAPFEKQGWEIIYYRLEESLCVNIADLRELLNAHHPDAVLVMNFYGIAPTDKAVSAIKLFNRDCLVIEDFSHCTFALSTIFNKEVDIYVSSIRKSVGVCDGAVILSRKEMDVTDVKTSDDKFATARIDAQTTKHQYTYTNQPDQKAHFREILGEMEGCLNEFDEIHYNSAQSKEMLMSINASSIVFARKINYRHLLNLLQNKKGIELLPNMELALTGQPFSLPILVERRDELQKIFAQKGLYAPVIWPISRVAAERCPVSKMMSKKMLSLPIDQRYSYDDIEEIGRIVIESIKEL